MPTRPQRARILIADDDDDLRAMLVVALAGDDIEVQEARDGRDLIDAIGNALLASPPQLPDAIITDVCMPGVSGLAALESIRQAGVETPVFVITGKLDATTHREAARLGVAAVFVKPFDVESLWKAVSSTLRRAH
jgi:DNA-binding NtrC family response regulator